MYRLWRSLLLGVRIVGLLWLDAYLLFRYWELLHPPASECGMVGCSLHTALFLFLLALGIGIIALLLDVWLRRARDIEEVMISAMHGFVIGLFAVAINFAVEKTPEFRIWLQALIQ